MVKSVGTSLQKHGVRSRAEKGRGWTQRDNWRIASTSFCRDWQAEAKMPDITFPQSSLKLSNRKVIPAQPYTYRFCAWIWKIFCFLTGEWWVRKSQSLPPWFWILLCEDMILEAMRPPWWTEGQEDGREALYNSAPRFNMCVFGGKGSFHINR